MAQNHTLWCRNILIHLICRNNPGKVTRYLIFMIFNIQIIFTPCGMPKLVYLLYSQLLLLESVQKLKHHAYALLDFQARKQIFSERKFTKVK